MSKHYEERYYVRDEIQNDYDEHRRSSSRRRSGSRHRAPPQPCPEEQYYRQRLARSGSGSSISSISDYEYRANCERPLVRVPRDVIRAPTPPPVIQRVVERAPTPEPDVVERVIVRPQPQQLIERIIERPRTPPPKIIDKEICEPAPPPIVRTRIVKVDHSPRHYANTTPIRYNLRPTNLCNYGAPSACTEYDYMGLGGYDQSYSQSYSTTELYPPPSQSVYPNASFQTNYQTPQMYQPSCMTGMTMPSQASQASQPPQHQIQMQMQQQPQQLMPQPCQLQQLAPQQLQGSYAQYVPVGPPTTLQYGYSSYNSRAPQMSSYQTSSNMQGIPPPQQHQLQQMQQMQQMHQNQQQNQSQYRGQY